MLTFPSLTTKLESCTCPSVLSLWQQVDEVLRTGTSIQLRAKEFALIQHLFVVYPSRPAEVTELMTLLAFKPHIDDSNGVSFGNF